MEGVHSPVLTVTLSKPDGGEESIDVDAHLDSGASTSLFDGSFLSALGVQLMNDRRKSFMSTTGNSVEAYIHRIRVTLPDLGDFDLDIGFSNAQIVRNLLGRDFFNFVQKADFSNVIQKPELQENKYQAFCRYINRESHSLGQNIFDYKEFNYDDFRDGLRLVFEVLGYSEHYNKMTQVLPA